MLNYKKIILCIAVAIASLFSVSADENRPNVLFIAVDDLRIELGCYGADHIKTPNIDRLATDGTLFEKAYCQYAVCSPSRSSLLTGRRPDSIKIYDLVTHFRKFTPDVVTLPEYFKNNEYFSQGMGKIFHLSKGLEDPQSWSVPYYVPEIENHLLPETLVDIKKRKAADEKVKEECEANGTAYVKAKIKGPPTEMMDVPDNAYTDGNTADYAIKTLNEIKDRKFFLAVGFEKPHLPFCAPRKYWELYDPSLIKVPGHERPEGAPDLALGKWGELRGYDGLPKEGYLTDDQARNLIHGYYASVSYADAQIGRVLDELDRLDLRKNTIVVLWGDHGWKLGEYGSWCKHSNFEVDTRAPLIFSLADTTKKGQIIDQPVEFVDIYATLAELCGLPEPETDGSSFASLFENPKAPWKKAVFSQYKKGSKTMGYSVKYGKWRYTEWINFETGELRARELYDHSQSDIAEKNLADSPEYKHVVEKLSKMLDKGQGWRAIQESLENK